MKQEEETVDLEEQAEFHSTLIRLNPNGALSEPSGLSTGPLRTEDLRRGTKEEEGIPQEGGGDGIGVIPPTVIA